jgi:hypothetical protein
MNAWSGETPREMMDYDKPSIWITCGELNSVCLMKDWGLGVGSISETARQPTLLRLCILSALASRELAARSTTLAV